MKCTVRLQSTGARCKNNAVEYTNLCYKHLITIANLYVSTDGLQARNTEENPDRSNESIVFEPNHTIWFVMKDAVGESYEESVKFLGYTVVDEDESNAIADIREDMVSLVATSYIMNGDLIIVDPNSLLPRGFHGDIINLVDDEEMTEDKNDVNMSERKHDEVNMSERNHDEVNMSEGNNDDNDDIEILENMKYEDQGDIKDVVDATLTKWEQVSHSIPRAQAECITPVLNPQQQERVNSILRRQDDTTAIEDISSFTLTVKSLKSL